MRTLWLLSTMMKAAIAHSWQLASDCRIQMLSFFRTGLNLMAQRIGHLSDEQRRTTHCQRDSCFALHLHSRYDWCRSGQQIGSAACAHSDRSVASCAIGRLPVIATPIPGRVAQRESTALTWQGSQVQSLSRPPLNPGFGLTSINEQSHGHLRERHFRQFALVARRLIEGQKNGRLGLTDLLQAVSCTRRWWGVILAQRPATATSEKDRVDAEKPIRRIVWLGVRTMRDAMMVCTRTGQNACAVRRFFLG